MEGSNVRERASCDESSAAQVFANRLGGNPNFAGPVCFRVYPHPNPPTVPPDHSVQTGITMVGNLAGVIVLYLRFVRIPGLFSSIEPIDDKKLAAQANLNYILCYVFSESAAL